MKKTIIFLILISLSIFAYAVPKRFAVIKNQKVVNIIIAEKLSDIPTIKDCSIVQSDKAQKEQSYIDGTFVSQTEKTQAEILAEKVAGLSTCSKLELYEAMKELDMLELFNNFKLVPEFEYENTFKFNHPVIIQVISTLDPQILKSIKEQIIKNREK